MPVKKLVLLDCDGVLSDFVGAAIDVAHHHSAKRWKVEDLTQWSFWKDMVDPDVPDLVKRILADISTPGFCAGIQPLPGAKEAVERLREIADIRVVTSPWNSPTWAHERFEWLTQHFDFPRSQVIQCEDKSEVDGDFLVDDDPKKLSTWASRRMVRGSLPVDPLLWHTHFNRNIGFTGRRVWSWDEVIVRVTNSVQFS